MPQNAAKNELLGAGAGLCRSLYIKVKRGKQDTSRQQKHEAKKKISGPEKNTADLHLWGNRRGAILKKTKGKANG